MGRNRKRVRLRTRPGQDRTEVYLLRSVERDDLGLGSEASRLLVRLVFAHTEMKTENG